MTEPIKRPTLFVRHIAIPQDHGSWIFILSPLAIGLFVGGNFSSSSVLLILAALAAFLIRQPVTVAVKAYSGRRSQRNLPAARFWIGVYGLAGLLALAGLVLQGFGYLLYLALPGLPVFAWHLFLVSRRAERRQVGIEILGSGVLALASPAALWVAWGYPAPEGWLLFVLVWLQSAASIVYAYARLEQRDLPSLPDLPTRLRIGRRALLYTSFNLVLVLGLSLASLTPPLLPLAYALQWLETVWGVLVKPAVGLKPTAIGFRQLGVSILFTITFIITWMIQPLT
jgi:hypothetical protein